MKNNKNNNELSRTARKGKRRLKKRYIVLIIVLLLAIAGGTTAWYFDKKLNKAFTGAHDGLDRKKSDLRDGDVDPSIDNVSILIMGIDASDTRGSDEIARTDALMVATFNVTDKSVKLLSIPRDSLVYIPRIDREDKINHAHAFGHTDKEGNVVNGGPESTIQTVENLLNIPIDYYVRFNFEAFMEIIDILDGIDIDVPYEITEQNSRDEANAIHLMPGMQRLDGEEALAFARTRKKDSDFMRGQRQQEVIQAIAKRSISLGTLPKIGDIIDTVGENMKHNMSYEALKSFFSYALNTNGLEIEAINIKGDDYRPDRVYYWKLDDESVAETSKELREHLELPIQNTTE